MNYCNSVLYGITPRNIIHRQRVQNSLACTVCRASYTDRSKRSITDDCTGYPSMHKLLLTHKVRQHHQTTYLSSVIIDYIVTQSLRSADTDLLVIPRTKTVSLRLWLSGQRPSRSVTACHLWSDHPFYHQLSSSTQISTVRRVVQLTSEGPLRSSVATI